VKDQLQPKGDGEPKKILVSEKIDLGRQNIQGLLETIGDQFRRPGKVVGFRYTRGDPLFFERQILEVDKEEGPEGVMATPYQAVRSMADIEIQEGEHPPLEALCRAVQRVTQEKYDPTFIVVHSQQAFAKWLGNSLRVQDFIRIRILEDMDAPAGRFFVCGSRLGPMIHEVEFSAVVRMS
jgi:hypothetical protein